MKESQQEKRVLFPRKIEGSCRCSLHPVEEHGSDGRPEFHNTHRPYLGLFEENLYILRRRIQAQAEIPPLIWLSRAHTPPIPTALIVAGPPKIGAT